MQLRVTLLSVFAALIAITTSQKCYGLDGTLLDDTFAPCNPTAKHSGCCATKRASGSDICLDNGLCMSTTNEYIGMIWQNGCTDSTGKDVACPKICPDVTNNFGGLNPVPAWNVQQCDYGKYCCRASNDRKSCCNNATAPKVNTASVGAFLVQTSTNPTPSATLVSASTEPSRAVATAVSTGTPLDLAPKDDVCSKERRQTAIVGGTIGSIFGAIILGLIGAAVWLYKREKHQRKMKEHYQEQIAQTNSYRRTIASSAVSLMGTDRAETYEEMKMKTTEA